MTGEKTWGLLGDLLETYWKHTSNYLGWYKDFYITLFLSLYTSLQFNHKYYG